MRGERQRHTLRPTALVNEAYLRLIEAQGIDWKDRAHFLCRRRTSDAPRAVKTAVEPVNPGLPRYDTLPGDRLLVAIAEPPPEHVRAPIVVLNWIARLREAIARK